jgi:hypothetical protein
MTRRNYLGKLLAAIVALSCMSVLPAARATEMATATISSTKVDPTTWRYDLTLNDTGTTNIGTFWFAWVPGVDFMPTSPFSIDQPVSWTSAVTNEGPSDGFAIQWQASAPSALLTSGHSLMGFSFDSTTPPQQMAGNSPVLPGIPIRTSFVYSGAPFSDGGFELTAQTTSVPEPSSMILVLAGGGLVACRLLRRRRH